MTTLAETFMVTVPRPLSSRVRPSAKALAEEQFLRQAQCPECEKWGPVGELSIGYYWRGSGCPHCGENGYSVEYDCERRKLRVTCPRLTAAYREQARLNMLEIDIMSSSDGQRFLVGSDRRRLRRIESRIAMLEDRYLCRVVNPNWLPDY